ncbi:hypothetical protein [Vibrio cyclitrophicus]|uniref:Uncharacterized protein n=1 Tax=Vibrio cyclitrophicus TaxID=47951 RepID=A0ACD5G434_9VIBR
MKRYKCTVSDKRGVMGDCMEEHKDGRWVRATVAIYQAEVIESLKTPNQNAQATRTIKELLRDGC